MTKIETNDKSKNKLTPNLETFSVMVQKFDMTQKYCLLMSTRVPTYNMT